MIYVESDPCILSRHAMLIVQIKNNFRFLVRSVSLPKSFIKRGVAPHIIHVQVEEVKT